jgi:hypothetical protein
MRYITCQSVDMTGSGLKHGLLQALHSPGHNAKNQVVAGQHISGKCPRRH